jgi:predicted nucleic acid-binding protein
MRKIFVDTDVCIDLLSGREPFHKAAEKLFSLGEKGKLKICVSALSFATIDYVLNGNYPSSHSRKILGKFKSLVQVLSVEERTIELALVSDFNDFEDAIQYCCAIEHNINTLITRNTKDYRKASIRILTPESFLTTLL